ncbi:MAG: chaperone NapD [bacterium]
MVIASLLIHCRSEFLENVIAEIQGQPGIEIVDHRHSKIALVLETETTEQAVAISDEIRATPGVSNLELLAHFFEDEVQENFGSVMNSS